MKTIAVVQARMGSTRLPDKVMRPLGGRPMIEVLLARLARSAALDGIALATSTHPRNDSLAAHVKSLGYPVIRGPEDDVLTRYLMAAEATEAEVLVRITGDCPLIDPGVVDAVIRHYRDSAVDYCSNTAERSFPDGLDTEVFSTQALRQAGAETQSPYDREHVTPYLRAGRFVTTQFVGPRDHSALRWTVDEAADLRVVTRVFDHFAPDIHFGWRDVLALQQAQPNLFADNAHIGLNEGSVMTKGQKLWKRAKEIIPGGSMLLSKRAEMFAPDQWPAYFSRARGCTVWDLDGTAFRDMGLMGVGTNTLGYGHPEVDAAVIETVQAGNLTSLCAPDEVALAERLIAMHPWAEMARFTRSGGEANAVAVRIARAASGKDAVAICGYHGWHDWYLASNLGDEKGLDGHLLPGLEPNGVPRALRGTVLPFAYNDLAALQRIVAEHDVGVIKMEVSRNESPPQGYLEAVRRLASEKGIVLVFDECTSGFRETFGGLHLKYGVEPDIAIFGKTLGNGYAVNAVIGRRGVMEAAQTSFISSTFWTERIGSAAAVKVLEVMERERSWDRITETGKRMQRGWAEVAASEGVEIAISGLPALTTFVFKGRAPLEYKTLVTQEMLAKGWLALTAFYASLPHEEPIIQDYLTDLAEVFRMVAACETGAAEISDLLKGPVCHAGFKRLN